MRPPVEPPEVTNPDALFVLPLDQFTSARDRLAGRLRDEDRTDEAVAVSRLRKPSVAAWALNRVSMRDPETLQRLVDIHQELRDARSAEQLRRASDERRRIVAELEAAAVAELVAEGRQVSGPTRSRISSTLLAVATNPEGENDLVAGRLEREMEPSGEGWGDIRLLPAPERPTVDRATAQAKRARARAEKLGRQAADAEHAVDVAQRALEDARRRADEARERADVAEAEAVEAESSAATEKRD